MNWNGPLLKTRQRSAVGLPARRRVDGTGEPGIVGSRSPRVMLAVQHPLRPAIVLLPASIAVIALFTLGVSLALTALSVYFADVREMYQAALPALLYMAPVIYPLSVVPERARWIVAWNPMTILIELMREPLYGGRAPSLHAFGTGSLIAVTSLAIGWAIFRRLAPRFESRW